MDSSNLAAQLAKEIAAGRWSEGQALPGVRMLAGEVGCSAGTAARERGVVAPGQPQSKRIHPP